jgi:hypothetical protein
MIVSIVIPVLNQHERLWRVLEQLDRVCVEPNTQLILIDNGSDPPIEDWLKEQHPYRELWPPRQIYRNETNIGVIESVRNACDLAIGDILAFTHYDVLIWDDGFDAQLVFEFKKDSKLGLAGLVGAPGVQPNGGRIGTASRLLGTEWGGNGTGEVWRVHGAWTPDGGLPCAVLDGCGIFFRKETIPDLMDMEYKGLHHAYDAEWSVSWLHAGWHVKALPIRADHGGGTAGGELHYGESAKQRAQELGITELPRDLQNWDQVQYMLNYDRFQKKWRDFLPVLVDEDFNAKWRVK